MYNGLRVGVVGTGPRVAAAVQALGVTEGVCHVRQMADAQGGLAGLDVMVEMVGGVEPAFRAVMAALNGGVACVATSPMLVAAHGRVLASAALGQHAFLGMSAAGFGLNLRDFVLSLKVTGATMVWGDGANMLMQRMAFRGENFRQIEAGFLKHNMDLSDAGGKVTQARAAAALGGWLGHWPRLSAQVRVGVEAVEPYDFRRLREMNLTMVYGAEVEEGGFYTGPMAVSLTSPLVSENRRDIVVLKAARSELVLTRDVDDEARFVEGIVGDVVEFMRKKPGHMRAEQARLRTQDEESGAEGRMSGLNVCYLRVPYGRRDALLANVSRVLSERVAGDGSWQAVVEGIAIKSLRLLTSDGMALPVVGNWVAPEAGLRLVG